MNQALYVLAFLDTCRCLLVLAWQVEDTWVSQSIEQGAEF